MDRGPVGGCSHRQRPRACFSAIESAIARVLVRLHEEVRRTLSASTVDQAQVLGKNPKGDRQRGFDVAADIAARRFLEREFSAGIILSEESDDHRFGDTERRWCENPFSHPRLRESLSANRRKGFLHESGRDRNLVPADTQAAPVYRFIVDPVDGSDNWARGLPLSSVAVAVLPAQGPIALGRVIAALVGGLDEETPVVATRG